MAATKKQATSSDVRYALEYGKERLIRTYDMEGHKTIYTLSPSNIRVPQQVFDAVSEFLEEDSPGLIPGHAQSYRAKVTT